MSEEYGWLIEFAGNPPHWWDGRDLGTGSADANQAVRFARREDAQKVALLLTPHREYVITEHGWA